MRHSQTNERMNECVWIFMELKIKYQWASIRNEGRRVKEMEWQRQSEKSHGVLLNMDLSIFVLNEEKKLADFHITRCFGNLFKLWHSIIQSQFCICFLFSKEQPMRTFYFLFCCAICTKNVYDINIEMFFFKFSNSFLE